MGRPRICAIVFDTFRAAVDPSAPVPPPPPMVSALVGMKVAMSLSRLSILVRFSSSLILTHLQLSVRLVSRSVPPRHRTQLPLGKRDLSPDQCAIEVFRNHLGPRQIVIQRPTRSPDQKDRRDNPGVPARR